jgi:cyclohexadienyl dehydratase
MMSSTRRAALRRLAWATLALAALAGCGRSIIGPGIFRKPVLRVATSGDYAPFSLAGDGGLEGLDIEVARRLGTDLGMPVEFVSVPWTELTAATRRGDFDVAMGGITMRADRALVGRYTRPYVVVGVVALIREAYVRRFPSVDALDQPGVRIAVNAGGHLERVARERFPRARVEAVPDNRIVPQRLVEGRVDAVITDTAEVRSWLRPGMRAVGPFRYDHKAYLLPAGDADLAARIDDWLVAREADGWLGSERARWLGTSPTPNPALATREAVVAFIALRLQLMPQVAAAKRAAGVPIADPEQEERVLERVRGQSAQPIYVEAVYRQLIDLAKVVQNYSPGADANVSLDGLRDAIGRIDQQLVRELDRAPEAPADSWITALTRTVAAPGIDAAALNHLAGVLAKQ